METFVIFRWIFGAYLTYHFAQLIPWAEELFGKDMPFDPSLQPTDEIFPNLLNHVDATYYLIFLTLVAISFMCGFCRRVSAAILWYGWASLLNRNVLIYNPGIPYVGWLLLVYAMVAVNKTPKSILYLAWFSMGLGYTISGLHKLQCPSWIDGTALIHVLNTPLARDYFLRDWVLGLPVGLLKTMTWGSLALEILFLPLGLFYHTRKWFWLMYMGFHIGILALVNFTDLTLGVMMIHMFTIENEWLFTKRVRKVREVKDNQKVEESKEKEN